MGGPDARTPGAVPEGGHPHERRRGPDLPRRRVRRGHVARRERPRRTRAVLSVATTGTTCARGRGRTPGDVPRRLTPNRSRLDTTTRSPRLTPRGGRYDNRSCRPGFEFPWVPS